MCETLFFYKLTKSLLANGSDVNALDIMGRTPIMRFLFFHTNTMTSSKNHILRFLLEYSDVNVVNEKDMASVLSFVNPRTSSIVEKNLLSLMKLNTPAAMILKHIAKLTALEITVHPQMHTEILKNNVFSDFYMKCLEELTLAKSIRLENFWASFFHILVGNRKTLKNFAGNDELMEDFFNSDCSKKFPIYGSEMIKKVEKGIERCRLYDKSRFLLSSHLPILNPDHLIIRDVLDCLKSVKDLAQFCE